jgi:hypothetical protein
MTIKTKIDQYMNRFVHLPDSQQKEIKRLSRAVITCYQNRQPDGLTPYEPIRQAERLNRIQLEELTGDPTWTVGLSNNPRRPEPFGLPKLPNCLM